MIKQITENDSLLECITGILDVCPLRDIDTDTQKSVCQISGLDCEYSNVRNCVDFLEYIDKQRRSIR